MNTPDSVPSFARARTAAWAIAALGVVGCVTGWIADRRMFAFGYLTAFVFWHAVALGLLGALMLQHVIRSSWGKRVRPWLVAAAFALPVLALLFLPIVVNARELYEWTHADVVAGDLALSHKRGYLNLPAFVARAFAYFVGWSLLARLLAHEPAASAEAGWHDPGPSEWRLRRISGVGLVFLVLSSTFASIDWIRSLSPHWVSSGFGLYVLMGQQLAGFAFTVLAVVWLKRSPPWSQRIDGACLHDLGKLLFASVSLWAYIAFTQFLIIWSGSVPEETEFYARRLEHGYGELAMGLIVLHFALPFALLMPRRLNERAGLLATVAALLLVMRLIDFHWLIGPSSGAPASAFWFVPSPVLAIGGIWSALVLAALERRARAARHEPATELAEVT